MNPQQAIVPVLAIDTANNVRHFLGTGSFVGDPPVLLTAEHVIRDWPERLAIAVLPDLDHLFLATRRTLDRSTDLAVLDVAGYTPEAPLPLADASDIKPNQPAVCFEYGTTRTEGKEITLSPATRLGNVTRTLDLTNQFDRAGEDMLELSFPALRGASGAPVMSGYGFALWGVVVANASYHLLPAQIESVLDPGGSVTEETRFMLPQALAVHVKHVRHLLSKVM